MTIQLEIDPEFSTMIPLLRDEELTLLTESILREGCRDPLVIWAGSTILMDGHNRYRICHKHEIPFRTVELTLPDRGTVADWIDANQLGRRNLNADQFNLLLGRRYNRTKKSHGGDRKSSPQNEDLKGKSAKTLAKQHGVSRATVERAGQFAAAVDKLKAVDPDIEKKVVRNEAPPRAAVVKAAEIIESNPEKAKSILKGTTKTADVIREMKREALVEKLESVKVQEVKKAQGVYDVIVIDPPWPMEKIERDERPNQSEMPYPTMTLDEIKIMGIPNATDCHIWIWTTQKFLPFVFEMIHYRRLTYVCTFTWHKPGGFQPVGLPQFNSEFAVYCRFGHPSFVDTKAFPACFNAPRGAHSEKPEEFYAMVRRTTAGRRLDMFSRRIIEGFDGCGQEAK